MSYANNNNNNSNAVAYQDTDELIFKTAPFTSHVPPYGRTHPYSVPVPPTTSSFPLATALR